MLTSNQPALKRFVKRLLIRSTLCAEEQEAILGLQSHTIQVEGRRDVVRPHDKVTFASLVIRGLAARFDQMANGRRQITAMHIPGDMSDLHSVRAPVAGWGIKTLTTTTMALVPHVDLLDLATRYPAIAGAFWADTIADASVLAKWVSNLGRRDAQARLAHLLCELGMRMELAELGTRREFQLMATQAQLANALGTTDVHMNRSIQALRRSGLIRTERRFVYVEDWDQLALLADFDLAFLLIPNGMQNVTPD